MWFKQLVGFKEENADNVREHLSVDGETMTSTANGKQWSCGSVSVPKLSQLRQQVHDAAVAHGKLRVRELVGDVQQLHVDPANASALFQVASQFNLLEMVSPRITPDFGVDIYDNDRTQGPACAIACGAATIFRNYFVSVGDQTGQTAECQIDCVSDLHSALCHGIGNSAPLWQMKNGYALASGTGLDAIADLLQSASADLVDQLRGELRVGLHHNAQVTIRDCEHTVTQAFCSALPVSYSSESERRWAPFAKLILESAYEATLCATLLNAIETGSNKCFLTFLGGGAFGNREEWILSAIHRALNLFADNDLDVAFVSYGRSIRAVRDLMDDFAG